MALPQMSPTAFESWLEAGRIDVDFLNVGGAPIVGGELVNPMTAAGDLILGTTPVSGVAPPIRLAKGADETRLRIDGTTHLPVWAAEFDATAPTTQVFGGAAATGSALTSARRDHSHGMPDLTNADATIAVGGTTALRTVGVAALGIGTAQIAAGAVTQAKVDSGYVDLATAQAAIAGDKTLTGNTTFSLGPVVRQDQNANTFIKVRNYNAGGTATGSILLLDTDASGTGPQGILGVFGASHGAATPYLAGQTFVEHVRGAGGILLICDVSAPIVMATTGGEVLRVEADGTGLTMGAGKNIKVGTGTGTKIGTAVDEKLAFHGATAVVQRAGAAQAAADTTPAALVSYGYTQTQADGIVTLLNEIRATLVEKGIMKGAA